MLITMLILEVFFCMCQKWVPGIPIGDFGAKIRWERTLVIDGTMVTSSKMSGTGSLLRNERSLDFRKKIPGCWNTIMYLEFFESQVYSLFHVWFREGVFWWSLVDVFFLAPSTKTEKNTKKTRGLFHGSSSHASCGVDDGWMNPTKPGHHEQTNHLQ